MRQTRTVFLLALVLVFSPLRATAAFILPSDAVIDVREFTFPATPNVSAERNLPSLFREQILHALEDAGLTLLYEQGTPIPGEARTPEAAPLTVTPLTNGNASRTGKPTEEKQGSGQEQDAGETGSEEENNASGNAENEETPAEPATRAVAVTHILEGNVTLFRETVGNPTRIAGGIRIRVEASIHCAYTIRDAETGKVLISNVTSGSSAKIASQDRELDPVLASLSNKAMADAAAKMAARLAGTETGHGMSDRSYYQDSPGKRLKGK